MFAKAIPWSRLGTGITLHDLEDGPASALLYLEHREPPNQSAEEEIVRDLVQRINTAAKILPLNRGRMIPPPPPPTTTLKSGTPHNLRPWK